MNKPLQTGVTLVELLVTLAILAILAAAATPSLSAMVERNQLRSFTDKLFSSAVYARSEAVKRLYDVNVCVRNSDASDCGTSGDFSNGWIVFVDCNGNDAPDTGAGLTLCDTNNDGTADAPEEILQTTDPVNNNWLTVSTTSAISRNFGFKPNGNISSGIAGSIWIRKNSDNRHRIIINSPTGRVRACTVPMGDTTCS